jgi:hypothetical protein
MRENFMSGIDEGRLDKRMSEACLLLYSMSRIRETATAGAVLTGPLAGADVSVYHLSDLDPPVYQTRTDINGYFHTDVTGLSHEELLLVKVSGGFDIEDGEPSQNLGAIHAVISGYDFVNGGFFVSAITDLVWQYTRNQVGETDTAGLNRRLDELSANFFQSGLHGGEIASRDDIISFSPLNADHKDALNFDYQIFLAPDDDGLSIINTYHQNLSDAQGLLLDSFFGDRLTRFPAADSQVDKVTLSVAVLGEGWVASDDNAVTIDTAVSEPASNVASVFYDPTDDKAVVLTALPTDDTEILSWQGCDLISEDGTQCTARMRTDHLVTLSFGYKQTLLNDTFELVDLSEETVIVDQDGITLDVTLTSGNPADPDSLVQGGCGCQQHGYWFSEAGRFRGQTGCGSLYPHNRGRGLGRGHFLGDRHPFQGNDPWGFGRTIGNEPHSQSAYRCGYRGRGPAFARG